MKINGVKLYFACLKATLKKKGLKSLGTGVLGTGKTVLHSCKCYSKKERVEVTGYGVRVKLHCTSVNATLKKKWLNSKKKGLKSLCTGYE